MSNKLIENLTNRVASAESILEIFANLPNLGITLFLISICIQPWKKDPCVAIPFV